MLGRLAPNAWVWGALAFLFSSLASPALAHDLWLLPGKYRLEIGEPTRVFVNNGDVFPESLTLLAEHRVTSASVRGPDGETAVSEFRVDGKSLTFELRPSSAGVYVVSLSTRPRTVRMQAEDFADYLEEEKLDDMKALREEKAETGEAAVERYTKWAKTIVQADEVGTASTENTPENAAEGETAPWAVPAGQTFELVPLDDPNRLTPGGSLRLRLLFQGQPLASARIIGARVGGAQREISETTDEAGEAMVSLPVAGRWYLRAIHMLRHDDDPEMHWESFWCTLTFEVSRPRGPASGASSDGGLERARASERSRR